jgi:putative ATP-dependent endonuclease of the OLD family
MRTTGEDGGASTPPAPLARREACRYSQGGVRLSHITIKNFRCIKQVDIDLGETTVFLGPNNAGKTAILDALRIALTRRWGQRGTGFAEYDVFLADDQADPKQSPGISIEIRAEELSVGEWSDELQQDLDHIIQTDAVTGASFITLQANCAWNANEACFEPSWTFLNAARAPLVGVSARRTNLERFWQYVPFFYLSALRDASDEFSPRSQFWGRLLKAMEIPSHLERRVERVLDTLNRKLLRADPKLSQIGRTLSDASRIATHAVEGVSDLRLASLKSWDLLSKADIVLRSRSSSPWLPLQRQGQGVQSLSVLFLFKAFVEHLLNSLYVVGSSPILALEEPETHLHPQAARTLWMHIAALPGQKLVATHSPYFVQHVPFRDLRLVRLTQNGTEVRSLPRTFSAVIPHTPALSQVINQNPDILQHDLASSVLTVHGRLDDRIYRKLLTCYGSHAEKAAIATVLRDLRDHSRLFVSDEDLAQLDTFARRIRGDILFARAWLLVEGQSEYVLVHRLSGCLGFDFDEHGVAAIDAVNCGSPAAFAALARAFAIPWLAVLDGGRGGHDCISALEGKDFAPTEIAARCRLLPCDSLEKQLLADGLEVELRLALGRIGIADADTMSGGDLERALAKHKTRYAAELAAHLLRDPSLASRMPTPFRDAITELKALT